MNLKPSNLPISAKAWRDPATGHVFVDLGTGPEFIGTVDTYFTEVKNVAAATAAVYNYLEALEHEGQID